MDRREFLRQSGMIGALLAMGRLPLLAREGDVAPVAVEPITGFLPGFHLTPGGPLGESYRLVFDVVHWGARDPATGVTKNGILGAVELVRRPGAFGVDYGVTEVRNYEGFANTLRASVACADDALNTLRAWRTTATYDPLPNSPDKRYPIAPLVESGRNEGGRVTFSDGRRERVLRPLVSQWTLLGFIARRADASTDLTLDVLRDLAVVNPCVRLQAQGTVDVKVAEGRTVPLASYLARGTAMLPTHYLVDESGLPQLITASMVSYALRSVEAGAG
jgi:hypothetical protein